MDELELEKNRVSKLSESKELSMKDVCPHKIYEDPNTGFYRCLVCDSDDLTKKDIYKYMINNLIDFGIEKEKDRPISLIKIMGFLFIIILLLGVVYNVFLNTVFSAQQRQIENHVISFLDSNEKNQEISVKFLFFEKLISLSKVGEITTVDLGSYANFSRHCIDTNFKIAKKEHGSKIAFKVIKSRCDGYEGGSVFSVESIPHF